MAKIRFGSQTRALRLRTHFSQIIQVLAKAASKYGAVRIYLSLATEILYFDKYTPLVAIVNSGSFFFPGDALRCVGKPTA